MDRPPSSVRPRPHGRRYPWDLWLRELPRAFVRGRDFDAEPAGFGITLRVAARARGIKVRVSVRGDEVSARLA